MASNTSPVGRGGATFGTASGQPRRRRILIEKKVTSAEYEKHKEKMEELGLDPSDPAPQEVDINNQAEAVDKTMPRVLRVTSGYPDESQLMPTATGGGGASASEALPIAPRVKIQTRPAQKMVSLQQRTIGEQVDAGKHERALSRFQEQQREWERFAKHAAAKTKRPEEHLAVNRAEEHRERLEVMELLDRATPEEAKSGGHSWYHSLRGDGTRFVQVGNMFSGLYLPVKMQKEHYDHEIVRKQMMARLVNSRVDENGERKGARTWRDDEYLLQRMKRYRNKIDDLKPGKLEHHEHLELVGAAIKPEDDSPGGRSASPTLGADALDAGPSEGPQVSNTDSNGQELKPGAHLEASPDRLQFLVSVAEHTTRTIKLKNTGAATVSYEWVRDVAARNYQESALPDDRTDRFNCNQTKGQLLPGREVETMFSFCSKVPGVFTTSWSLHTKPELVEKICNVNMHGIASEPDLLTERRGIFQQKMREQQVLHQVEELVEDVVAAVKLQQPAKPSVSDQHVQARLFEDLNANLGLHYSPHAWAEFKSFQERLSALRIGQGNRSHGTARTSPDPAQQGGGARPRGILPCRKPAPEVIFNHMASPAAFQVPDARQMERALATSPNFAGSEPEKAKLKAELTLDMNRALRSAQKGPVERSPLYHLAYETITEIVRSIPGKVKSTRRMYSLQEYPFIPPLNDGASPAEEESHKSEVEARTAMLGEAEKEAEWKEKLLSKIGTDIWAPRLDTFSGMADECSKLTRLRKCAALSLRERFQPYLDRQDIDSIELGGSLLMYELDLSFLKPALDAAVAAGGGQARFEELFAFEDMDEREYVKTKLQGVMTLMESSPVGVLVVVHLGRPAPDEMDYEAAVLADYEAKVQAAAEAAASADVDPDATDEQSEDPLEPPNLLLAGVAERMKSLPSTQPLLELLQEVLEGAATSVEFVPHDVWLGSAEAFAEKARNDLTENKVFLLENFAAFPEELGEQRMMVAAETGTEDTGTAAKTLKYIRVPWARREAWAARAFAHLKPDMLVQDGFASACTALTTQCGYWLGHPSRYFGLQIEAEFVNFLDAIQLPFRSGKSAQSSREEDFAAVKSSATAAAKTDEGEGEEENESPRISAPLLIVLGGGGFSGPGGEEILMQKLELLIVLSRLARHETDGLIIHLGGELAVVILGLALDIPIGILGPFSLNPAMKLAVQETVLEMFRDGSALTLEVPLDVNCQEVRLAPKEEIEDPKDKKKPKGKEAAPTEPEPLQEMVVDLQGALRKRANEPIRIGMVEGEECYLKIDPEAARITMSVGEVPPPPPPPPPVQNVESQEGELAAAAGDAPTGSAPVEHNFSQEGGGVPPNFAVCDIGTMTMDLLQKTMSKSRGVLWNGALGRVEEERFQAGTRSFLAALTVRITGEEDEDTGAAVGDVPESASQNGSEGDGEEEEAEEEEEIEFEFSAVIGRDSRAILPRLGMTPGLISFVSSSGEGLMQVLRGEPLPGLMACVEAS